MRSTTRRIATEIIQARQRAEFTRQRLAQLAGITTPTVTAWEECRGRTLRPLVAVLRELGLELRVVVVKAKLQPGA